MVTPTSNAVGDFDVVVTSSGSSGNGFFPAAPPVPGQISRPKSDPFTIKDPKITISYRAFIRANWVKAPVKCLAGFNQSLLLGYDEWVRGDNRSFELNPGMLNSLQFPGPPYRVSSTVSLWNTARGFTTIEKEVKPQGVSRMYDTGARIPDGTPPVDMARTGYILNPNIPDTKQLCTGIPGLLGNSVVEKAQGVSAASVTTETTSDGGIRVRFAGSGSDPNIIASSVAGPIKWDLTVKISKDASTANILGEHTCFPAHEIIVNGKFLYRFGPNWARLPNVGPPGLDDNDVDLLAGCLLPIGFSYITIPNATINLR